MTTAQRTIATLPPRAPAEVLVPEPRPAPPASTAPVVRAVIPCYGREADLAALLGDFGVLDTRWGDGRIDLEVVVVDNASPVPLEGVVAGRARVLRLERNTGGSGGFNAGLLEHLRAWREPAAENHFLWLVDSDVRLRPGTLRELVAEMERRPACVVAGSTLADPATGEPFETGGHVDRATGELVQPAPCAVPTPVEYVAACSMLVRRHAALAAGLMRALFLNGDDAEWCLRLARVTGGEVVCVPASVVTHPRPDRMRTLPRYYSARNAVAYLLASGAGARARFVRAVAETARAIGQHLVGRDDIAALHTRGLRDAAAGRVEGPINPVPALAPPRSLAELWGEVEAVFPPGARVGVSGELPGGLCGEAVTRLAGSRRVTYVKPAARGARRWALTLGALTRLLTGAPFEGAVVSARARSGDWFLGRTLVVVDETGFVTRRLSAPGAGRRVIGTAARGLVSAVRLACLPPRLAPVDRPDLPPLGAPGAPRLTIAVLGFNRAAALRRTLTALRAQDDTRDAEIIVVDNASTDGSAAMVRAEFPGVRVIALEHNVGVAGFNRAVDAARAPYVLVLDDDACPAPGAVGAALSVLEGDGSLGGVALHPRHPRGGASEWPFAGIAPRAPRRWPVMGCANLVRRDAWRLVGGYDEEFFLYRNDCDLAMKLLGAGFGVFFDPALVVWHDSPQAASKSRRWFELATRNWIFLARRHGRGTSGAAAALAGWAWAHRLAGLSPAAHWRVLRGAAAGLVGRPAGLPPCVTPDGRALRDLLALQLASRAGRSGPDPPPRPPPSSSTPSSQRHSA